MPLRKNQAYRHGARAQGADNERVFLLVAAKKIQVL
jgi:hypothetical protein